MKRIAVLLGAFAALALMSPAVIRAQDASPVPGSDVPAPEECTVAPITLERLTLLVATPVPMPEASPVGSPIPFAMPEGQPADATTVAEVTAVARQYIACINAGDLGRALGLYSDRALTEILLEPLAGGATPQEILDALGSPQALPENERTALYSVANVQILSDGRVAAVIIGDDLSSPGPAGPALIYFVAVDGSWLVDGFVPTEQLATPTP